jgi:hypothetical protein
MSGTGTNSSSETPDHAIFCVLSVFLGPRITRFQIQKLLKFACDRQLIAGRAAQDYNRRKARLWLPHGNYEEALTFADEDLDENWDRYRSIFLRGERP